MFRENMCKPKANELVRFAEVPPCFGKLTKLILKFNFLLISRAIARLNILSFHRRVNCYIVPKTKNHVFRFVLRSACTTVALRRR